MYLGHMWFLLLLISTWHYSFALMDRHDVKRPYDAASENFCRDALAPVIPQGNVCKDAQGNVYLVSIPGGVLFLLPLSFDPESQT